MTVNLSSPYWRLDRQVETVLPLNGGRLHYSHYLRVLEARLSAEQTVPAVLLPLTVFTNTPTAGRER